MSLPPDLEDATSLQRSTAPEPSNVTPVTSQQDGETLMDQMMAAHAAARAAKNQQRADDEARMSKSFGDGLQGGFFAKQSSVETKSADAEPAAPAADPKPTQAGCANPGCTGVPSGAKLKKCGRCKRVSYCSQACQRAHWRNGHREACSRGGKSSAARPRATAHDTLRPESKSDEGLRIPEVQKAMADSASPLAEQLKSGEWLKPELLDQVAQNPVLARGLANPRFTQAMQEMQQNPEAAMRKYQGDRELQEFMVEFGQIMGSHFESMAAESATTPTTAEPAVPAVQELPPGLASLPKAKPEEEAAAEAVWMKAAEDPEVREILQDGSIFELLHRCSQDPMEFRRAMSDPDTAAKLRKLSAAGLVQVAP